MALYRFRVTFEDYDEVVREIDIKSNQTFEDLHRAIHNSTGYNAEFPSSFYISNDQWTKGDEITYLPNQKRINRGVPLMGNVKLRSFIDDPHQKFYYTFNFDRPFDFHVELLKIILEEAKGVTYPAVIKSVGEAPKQFGNIVTTIVAPPEVDDFDFLNEQAFSEEDASDFSEISDTVDEIETIKKAPDDEDDDEFSNEFHDEEGFEDEDKLAQGDDY
jgi:hypothetical protein